MKSKFTLAAFIFFISTCICNKVWAQCPPTITQPANRTICIGSNAFFQTFSTGTVTYQWQEKQSSLAPFTNLTNVPPYSGATSPNLNIASAPTTFSGYQYRCVITSTTCGATYNTNVVTLTVNGNTSIDIDPTDTITCAGAVAAFMVTASGANLTYQWQSDNGTPTFSNITASTVYSGVTSATLVLTNVPSSYSGYKYRCIVTGTCGGLPPTSQSAKLTVNTPPAIAIQPVGDTVCQGSVVQFNIGATGSANLVYQWQENSGSGFINLSDNLVYIGSGSSQLTIFNVTGAMNGNRYRCLVSDGCTPNATSNVIDLLVNIPPVIVDQTPSVTTCEGDGAKMYVSATGLGVTYQWQINVGGTSGYVPMLNNATYSGVNTDTLRFATTNNIMDGNLYNCVVTDGCSPDYTAADIPLTVVVDKQIEEQPRDTTIEVGKDSWFKIHAAGANLTYVWQCDIGNGFQSIQPTAYYSGINTEQLQIALTPAILDGFKYRCLVYGGCRVGPVSSNEAKLSIKWPTSIKGVRNGYDASVYPNPVTGKEMTIKLDKSLSGNINYKVINQFGSVISTGASIINSGHTVLINVNTLASGIYTIHLTNDNDGYIKAIRFTKQ